MCGIAGFIYFDKNRSVDPDLMDRMTDALFHRGPDDRGVYISKNVALGFRRLSIIDLTPTGHQPMSNEDATVWGVFNGEVYNFPELRTLLETRGHIFKGRSDSEVIIHAYEEYGEECVKRFNGMFAIALWDEKKQKLFCARDRAGEKPFFYYIDNEKFIFASEIKSILADSGVRRSIDFNALNSYLSYMYIPEPYSIFQGIKKLPPAHSLVYSDRAIKISEYWRVPYKDLPARPEAEYAEELKGLLSDAVRIRLVSDVPLGIFLSGGIDSSSIVSLASGMSAERIKTFAVSGGSGLFNELPYARIVAKECNTDHYEFEVRPESVESLLPKLIRFIDEPFADSSIIPTYYVSKMARQKVTVALSGEGADELFAGYPWHVKNIKVDQLRKIIPSYNIRRLLKSFFSMAVPRKEHDSAWKRWLQKLSIANDYSLLPFGEDYESINTLFDADLKGRVLNVSAHSKKPRELFVKDAYLGNGSKNVLERALYADLKTYLPGDLLVKNDRMSMANSLETRAPFLDHRIIEFAANIPPSLKIKHGISKYILRRSMNNLVPRQILERKDKRGFAVPVEEWFRGELKNFSEEILLDKKTLRRGILSETGIRGVLRDHQARRYNYGNQIWSLIVFELWAREYL